MFRLPRRAALLLCVALASACTSISTVQRARTLGRGNAAFALEVGAIAVARPTVPSLQLAPRGDLSARWGLTDRFDLGGRVGSSGAELMTKVLLSSPDSRSLHLSLAPSLGAIAVYGQGGTGGLLGFHLPMLFGVQLGGESELVLGARVSDLLFFSSQAPGGRANVVYAGGSLGFSWQVLPALRLHPEVAILYPVTTPVAALPPGSFAYDGPIVQLALGIQFES